MYICVYIYIMLHVCTQFKYMLRTLGLHMILDVSIRPTFTYAEVHSYIYIYIRRACVSMRGSKYMYI